MPPPKKLSLKAFWETLDAQLSAASADDLRELLRAMAKAIPPSERQAFLDILKKPPRAAARGRKALDGEDLLDDMDGLVDEIESMMEHADAWEDRFAWRDPYYDEDSLGVYQKFVEPIQALFQRTEAAFEYGDLALARAAYEKLFGEVLLLEDDYGRGVRAADLTGVDLDEARARYLRAAYESEPPRRRPKALFEAMEQSRSWFSGARPSLDDFIQISPKPLPDQDRFLSDWIAYLKKKSGPHADAWLREAIRLSQGTRGLEELARAEGKQRPRAYLDWVAALLADGEAHEALAAAREALHALPARLPLRAAIADHLCTAAEKMKDSEALRAGRWEAFAAQPSLVRLLDLWDVAPPAERRDAMRQAARHMKNYKSPASRSDVEWLMEVEDRLEVPTRPDRSALAHAHLLAEDWDAAHELAARGKSLGWSDSENPQGLVVAFFLAWLSGKPAGKLPKNLSGFWRRAMGHSLDFDGWYTQEADVSRLIKRIEYAHAGLTAAATLGEERQEALLAWCLDTARKRVDVIVGGQKRGSYDKAAELTGACAEVLRLRGRMADAKAWVDEIRNRFPRHHAFLRELNTATGTAGQG